MGADRALSHLVWVSTKAVYSGLIYDREDWEIAETFFNSVTRRIFTTVGVNEEIEFVHTDFSRPPTPPKCSAHHSFVADRALASVLQQLLREYDLQLGDAALQREATIAAEEIQRRLAAAGPAGRSNGSTCSRRPFTAANSFI